MSPEQFHEQIWETLQDINKEQFHAVAARSPTTAAITQLELTTGITLPKNFLAFTQRTNGLCILAKEEVWPEAKLFDVGPAWTFYRGVVILGIEAEELPEWANIQTAYNHLVETYDITDVLPLLKVIGDSNHYWGVKADGCFVEVFDDEVTHLDSDFIEIYSTEIKELLQRQHDMSERLAQRKNK